jgi:Na+/proline symporter
MNIGPLDWSVIGLFMTASAMIGVLVSRRAGRDTESFFLSQRNMPWWLLGISMVATTFAADTPLLVTNIVRRDGVAGNWVWWAFLLTGMLTTFVYARLWRRSGVFTDLEFYELRYSGRPASVVRAFRAIYLGVFFNVIVMATVCLAAIKISAVMLGASPLQTLAVQRDGGLCRRRSVGSSVVRYRHAGGGCRCVVRGGSPRDRLPRGASAAPARERPPVAAAGFFPR